MTAVVDIRAGLGLTQAQLASLIGVNPFTVSKYERAVLAPGAFQRSLLDAFAAALPLPSGHSPANDAASRGVPFALYRILHAAYSESRP